MRTGITPAEALQIVLEHAPLLGAETIAVADARGRVLAAGVRSNRRLPPSDNSAMDGFAVRSEDLVSASADHPVALEVIYEIPAGGSSEQALRAGEAARVLTGAPIPPGSDAVVRQEDTTRDGNRVTVRVSPEPRTHIRDAGEDVGLGDQVLDPGAVVGPAEIGMLASLGR
ncbi:MAG: molybdopterin molybdenumtransferase MoeA, partial [Myxococcota bacterium]